MRSGGDQPFSRASLNSFPAPVRSGGDPLIPRHRSRVLSALYLTDFDDNSSNSLKPQSAPPLAANKARPTLFQASQSRSSFSTNAIASISSSGSVMAGGPL